ncbi:LodA/GoxA family CTQ-dependent oxidase, partial [Pseudomonas viridiflava]
MKYVIGPSVGIARVGNSPTEFYLAPEKLGGRPLECSQAGDQSLDNG